MFELGGMTYTLRFNKQKIKTVELTTGISIVSALTANKGILSYQTVETLFVSGLVEEQGLVAVKQKEGLDIFDKLVEEKGLISLNVAVIEKLQEDMGFLFR
ncbi:segregation and condensation protein B [Listeria welshimeri]|uniref:segregation and condensation protein B n=1 Tax=Listeria welshimeri TaxID=1643 RepID=UPI0018889C95|nr:segregation and condensation protein B [Listeria welshimeri]MBF2450702.1 segregation and condensation protein B [Listeria welshimeri]